MGEMRRERRKIPRARSLVDRLRGGVYGLNRIPLCIEAAARIEYLELQLKNGKGAAFNQP